MSHAVVRSAAHRTADRCGRTRSSEHPGAVAATHAPHDAHGDGGEDDRDEDDRNGEYGEPPEYGISQCDHQDCGGCEHDDEKGRDRALVHIVDRIGRLQLTAALTTELPIGVAAEPPLATERPGTCAISRDTDDHSAPVACFHVASSTISSSSARATSTSSGTVPDNVTVP